MTQTERSYYIVVSLYHASWSFIGPVYTLFLLSRGLDLLQINLVLATYLITAFLFEMPTGAIADVFGRKFSFILSCLVRMCAFLLYSVSTEFEHFLVAEFVDAIGTTLATGALDAWAVDGMRHEGKDGPTDRFFAKAQLLARTLMIVVGIAAGYIAAFGLEIPWLIAAATFLTTAIVAALLMKDDRVRLAAESTASGRVRLGVIATVGEGWSEVQRHAAMRVLCLLTAATAFAMMPALHTWPPRMQALHSEEGYWVMGWIWALLNLATVFASVVVPRLLHLPRAYVIAAATLMRAVMLALAAVSPTLAPAIIGFLLFEFAAGLSEPLMLGWMNQFATPERRATVLSVRQMSFTFGGAVGLVVLGAVALASDIPTAWLVGAATLVFTAVAFVAFRVLHVATARRRASL